MAASFCHWTGELLYTYAILSRQILIVTVHASASISGRLTDRLMCLHITGSLVTLLLRPVHYLYSPG